MKTRTFLAAWVCCWFLLLLLTTPFPAAAQLSIQNPKKLDVPEEKAQVIFHMACEVVAREFQVTDPSAMSFLLTLVLGEKDEHYVVDEKRHAYTLYMTAWDETKFAALALRLCVQHLPTRAQEAQLVREILRRSARVSPVSVSNLRKSETAPAPPQFPNGPGPAADCNSAVRDQPCQTPDRRTDPAAHPRR